MIVEARELRRMIRRMLVETSHKWMPATKKNVHQDGTSKSRGYWSGDDKTWTGQNTDDVLNSWYKSMGLMEDSDKED